MTWFGNPYGHSLAARKRVNRTVPRVIDEDTFKVKRKINGSRFVRLSGYDAPEKNERGGHKATSLLREMIGGKRVSITPVGKSYGRTVAIVRVNHKNVNKRMKQYYG